MAGRSIPLRMQIALPCDGPAPIIATASCDLTPRKRRYAEIVHSQAMYDATLTSRSQLAPALPTTECCKCASNRREVHDATHVGANVAQCYQPSQGCRSQGCDGALSDELQVTAGLNAKRRLALGWQNTEALLLFQCEFCRTPHKATVWVGPQKGAPQQAFCRLPGWRRHPAAAARAQ